MRTGSASRKGFTLLEMMVVVVIIGILAGLAITQYHTAQDKALEREATSNLKLIAAAERVYRLETGAFVNCSNNSMLNGFLSLMLSVNNPKWNYTVFNASATNFTANATSLPVNQTIICINESVDEPYKGGGCL